MALNLDSMFNSIRNVIFALIQEKQIDIDVLALELGINRYTFIENFSKRINNFAFYLQTLSLVENWEG